MEQAPAPRVVPPNHDNSQNSHSHSYGAGCFLRTASLGHPPLERQEEGVLTEMPLHKLKFFFF